MKKIGALILLLATITLVAASFTGCSNKSHIPEDMQVVSGSDALGYYFYAPEEWTISNVGDIKSAYVSRVDTTSVSLVKVDPKNFLPDGKDADTYFFGGYFTDSTANFKGGITISNPDGEFVTFGKEGETADKAKRYAYTYDYFDQTAGQTIKFGFMQYLLKHDGEYYIFTYAASMETKSGSELSYYEYYLDRDDKEGKLSSVINNFRFVDKNGDIEETEYKKDSEGYILASNPALAGFNLYVPETFKVDYSSAIVSATHSDGTNVNMTLTPGTNENVNAYMHRRLSELKSFVDAESVKYDVKFKTDEEGNILADEEGNAIVEKDDSERPVIKYEKLDEFGGAINAYAYEYTYEIGGVKYYVYQIISIEGWLLDYKGYVFTYTAKYENHSLHSDELEKIVEKVKFE